MALVLVGANSYSLVYTDESGVERRTIVRKGQDVSQFNLSGAQIKELKKVTVRLSSRRVVPMFMEMDMEPGPFHAGRHIVGGRISNDALKAQKAANDAVEEAISVTEAEPKVEAEKKAPAKKAPAKKKTASKKSKAKK